MPDNVQETQSDSIWDRWIKEFRGLVCRPWATVGLITIALCISGLLPQRSIELIKALLSWPVAIVVIALTFGKVFRDPLKKLIESNKEGELSIPGGSSLKWKTSASDLEAVAQNGRVDDLQSIDQSDSAHVVQELRATSQEEYQLLRKLLTSSEQEKQGIKSAADTLIKRKDQLLTQAAELIQMKHSQAVYWWFMYLSSAFPDVLKTALHIFSTSEAGLTRAEFDQKISKYVSDEDQKRTIVIILLQYGLIELDGPATMRITRTGNDFMRFFMNLLRGNMGMKHDSVP